MASDILVTTADGTLRGRRVGKLRAWRGIPYARPPVGTLRLTRPQPVTPWIGERDATRFGDASVQHKKGLLLAPGKYQPSSEDCLTLNVLAPANTGNTPRPVMVFIHGGANTIGTSATGLYSGVSLVERGDVVYVSINYRLGALATSISPRSPHPSAYSTPTSDCAIRSRPCSGCNATSPPSVGILKKSRFSVNPPEPPPSPP